MKRMRCLALLMAAVITAGLLLGCRSTANKLPANEVLTTSSYDTAKETLVLSVSDTLDWEKLKKDLEAHFPDVNIVLRHGMTIESAVFGDTADIYLSLQSAILAPEVEARLLDLSAFESTSNYYTTALASCASINDGKQYMLPMPCNIRGIIYNKTMFEENGWEVPHGKTEFVELCHTIDASGVVDRAFQPSLLYPIGIMVMGEFFQMSNLFDTLDYFTWAENYQKSGEGSASFILPALLDSFQYLLDEDVIELSDFSLTPVERSIMLYKDRTAAMTIETQNASLYATQFGSSDEFAMMPFYSGDKPGDDYVMTDPTTCVGVNAKVADKGNEDKLKLVTEFLDFIATKEGQNIFVSEENIAMTQLKNAEIQNTDTVMLKNVAATLGEGRMVPIRPLFNGGINLSRNACNDVITGMLHTERRNQNIIKEDRAVTYEEAVAYLDQINQEAINHAQSTVETVYATATKPFTVLETTEYLAQMLQEQTGADIGLYLSNTLSRGNNMAIYQGDLVKAVGGRFPYDFLTSLDTSIRTKKIDKDDKKIVTLKMTGSQILKALEYPENGESATMFEPFFVAAGLKIEFAPWAEQGSRYRKVTLADGSELQPDKEYTVAAWNHTIAEECITERIKVYENSFQDLLKTQLQKDGEIAPFTDDRFVLNWDIVAENAK